MQSTAILISINLRYELRLQIFVFLKIFEIFQINCALDATLLAPNLERNLQFV